MSKKAVGSVRDLYDYSYLLLGNGDVIKSETLMLINLGGGEGAGSCCCFN